MYWLNGVCIDTTTVTTTTPTTTEGIIIQTARGLSVA